LLILGVLHRGDFHPYEIKRRLEAAMVECYIDVDVGTLYYAVRKLEKERLIEAVAEERVARGGVRTIYRITADGRAAFRNGLHRQLEVEGPVSQTLYGALLFLHLADAEAVEAALRRRLARLDELIAKLRPIRDELAPRLSTGGAHLLRHIEEQRKLDRKWTNALLAELEANGIRDVADPAALAKRC
jgi:DNA-binding PadR family transcriptional regulator